MPVAGCIVARVRIALAALAGDWFALRAKETWHTVPAILASKWCGTFVAVRAVPAPGDPVIADATMRLGRVAGALVVAIEPKKTRCAFCAGGHQEVAKTLCAVACSVDPPIADTVRGAAIAHAGAGRAVVLFLAVLAVAAGPVRIARVFFAEAVTSDPVVARTVPAVSCATCANIAARRSPGAGGPPVSSFASSALRIRFVT